MDNVTKRIEIDLYSPTSYEVIKAQQGDNNSRIVEFVLYDQGKPYTISNNMTISLEGHRGDNSYFQPKDCTVSNNVITAVLDSDILYEAGTVEAKIVMYNKSDNSILSTIPFRIHVQKNPCNKNKIESEKHSMIDWLILNFEKLKTSFQNLSSNFTEHIADNIRHITSDERTKWNDSFSKRHTHSNKNILDDITASYTTEEKNKLNGIQNGAEVNIQSDWNITDNSSDAYIKNKPSVYTKTEVDNKFSTLETNIDWKESVATYNDIAITYPNPQDGWTVNTKDTDYTYRFDGNKWVVISANAIPKATNAVDGLLSKEDHTNYDDANTKKHVHSNKSILDKITQSLLDNWNTAYTHISDSIKHITSSERTLWNTVSNKVDKVEGKGLSTNDYTTADKNIVANMSNGTVTGVKGSAESSYRTGNVELTAANIGLGNVDNTSDANKSVAYASSAGSASMAGSDGNGNSISYTYLSKTDASNTYLSKSGGTITGNLTLKGNSAYGNKINFGDNDYVYLYEDTDDHLTIKGDKGISLVVGDNYNARLNGYNIITSYTKIFSTTGTNTINWSADVFNRASELYIYVFSTKAASLFYYCYSWIVDKDTLGIMGTIRLVDGYKHGSYEGIAEVEIGSSYARIISMKVGNVDFDSTATLRVVFR